MHLLIAFALILIPGQAGAVTIEKYCEAMHGNPSTSFTRCKVKNTSARNKLGMMPDVDSGIRDYCIQTIGKPRWVDITDCLDIQEREKKRYKGLVKIEDWQKVQQCEQAFDPENWIGKRLCLNPAAVKTGNWSVDQWSYYEAFKTQRK